ncbi:MAG: glycosyltransferase family 2 protein [Armatimonadota bacterium]|nr:glycosyltransferase family 2 protein [Armatimonadota bacterium]MDR7537084.1 glycosyltransferase family 2 protein [Armatimonadota bacterium]
MPALSVVIPTRNEREALPSLLREVRAALDGVDYELIFVDDSTDGTDAVLADMARADCRVTVYHRHDTTGLASAVVEGIARSRGEAIAVLDADLQHPPGLLPVMLQRLEAERADLVVASRYLPGAGAPGLSRPRRVVSILTRLLAQALLRGARRSTDPLSGFFVVRRAAVEGVALRPVGFKILLEILVRGRYARVAEVPYAFGPRAAGQTKATMQQGVEYLRHVALLLATSPGDARLWKFLLVGASGMGVNVAVFWFLTHPLGVHYFPAGLVAGGVSTFTNYLLNSAFTWADRPAGAMRIFLQRLGKYYMATWAGNMVYLGLLTALAYLGLAPMLANLVAVAAGGGLNYLMHNVWTWGQQGART